MPAPAAGHPRPAVGVVVVTHRSGPLTLRCLDALAATTWPGPLRVVLVDNASGDGLADEVEATRPHVQVVRSPRNGGFGAGCNRGFEALGVGGDGGPELVALVNPDVEVEPGWLGPLVTALEDDSRLAAACPLVLFDRRHAALDLTDDDVRALASVVVDGEDRTASLRAAAGVVRVPVAGEGPWAAEVRTTGGGLETLALGPAVELVQNAGNELDDRWFVVDRGLGEVDGPAWRQPAEVFGWSGAAVLLRAAHLVEVGTFDERLFLYYEDTDLAWRARLAGWRHAFVPGSVVRHRLGASTRERSPAWFFHVQRGRLVVLLKHAPLRALATVLADQARGSLGGRLGRPGPPARAAPVLAPGGRRRAAALASALRLAPALLARRSWRREARRARAAVATTWRGRGGRPDPPSA